MTFFSNINVERVFRKWYIFFFSKLYELFYGEILYLNPWVIFMHVLNVIILKIKFLIYLESAMTFLALSNNYLAFLHSIVFCTFSLLFKYFIKNAHLVDDTKNVRQKSKWEAKNLISSVVLQYLELKKPVSYLNY